MSHVEKIRNWYARFERPISSLSLVGGFVFDAITLKRVDTLWENLWVCGHLLIVAIFIILIHTGGKELGDEANPSKKHFWYVNILQFFFGGILSTYLVFYFRSADLFTTWPFIFLLAGAFILNESLKRHYVRFSFQISLFFFSVYSFAIFILPVILHLMGPAVFILSGIISLVIIFLFTSLIFYIKKDEFDESRRLISSLIFGIFFVVNFLYFTNLIPPIPLSIKDAGIYHAVSKNKDGTYSITYEDSGFWSYFKLYKDFHIVNGEAAYAYSAVFSPLGLNLTVIHEWEYFDAKQNKWITYPEIELPVIGGRDGGFQTYSLHRYLTPGHWRVNIKTIDGQIIGRIRLNVISVDQDPLLKSEIK